MPQMKKMSTPPPTPISKSRNSGNVGGQKGFKSQQKKDPAARKRPILSPIYGDEVLSPSIKKEKEIVVAFHPFTKNNLRISVDGKFIIQRFSVEELEEENGEKLLHAASHWNLLYYKEPLTNFSPPSSEAEFKNVVYEIDSSACEVFSDFSCAFDLTNKIISLVRKEYFQEKELKKKELEEQERKLREDEEKLREKEENKNSEEAEVE